MAALAAPAIVLLGVLLILGHPVADNTASATAWHFKLKLIWFFLAMNGYDYLLSGIRWSCS
jgi:hypothetical protein